MKTRIPPILEFDVAWSHFDFVWGHFDVPWLKLWYENDVFDEILGCAGHLTLPKKKWAPVAVKIFYKYALQCTHDVFQIYIDAQPDNLMHNLAEILLKSGRFDHLRTAFWKR